MKLMKNLALILVLAAGSSALAHGAENDKIFFTAYDAAKYAARTAGIFKSKIKVGRGISLGHFSPCPSVFGASCSGIDATSYAVNVITPEGVTVVNVTCDHANYFGPPIKAFPNGRTFCWNVK